MDHALIVGRRVVTHNVTNCTCGRFSRHGCLNDARNQASPLLRAQGRAGDNARDAKIVILALAGRFDDMQGAHETRGRRRLAFPGRKTRMLRRDRASVFGRGGCMESTPDLIAPDMGSLGPMFGSLTAISGVTDHVRMHAFLG